MSKDKFKIPIENGDDPKYLPENGSAEQNKSETQVESCDKYIDMLKRLQAEFDNYRKRIQKEKAELSSYAKSQLIYNLLPVIDDFHHMFRAESGENKDGVNLIFQKLMTILENEGLKTVEATGEKFNPEYHEAVIIEPTETDDDDKVTDEIQKGYLFNEQLLRPAKVKVMKRKS
ncbi:nucleotide exchange factor GrpE [candidate division KSB1 bacterium]|nr:nucleotide exchange factor GrpE [candidate division KSB1 bacterium]